MIMITCLGRDEAIGPSAVRHMALVHPKHVTIIIYVAVPAL